MIDLILSLVSPVIGFFVSQPLIFLAVFVFFGLLVPMAKIGFSGLK